MESKLIKVLHLNLNTIICSMLFPNMYSAQQEKTQREKTHQHFIWTSFTYR